MTRHFALAALAATLVACGGAGHTVPVEGKDEEVGLLAGKWEGTYTGTESGRQGSVQFDLALGNHAAEGQVIMNTGAGPGTPLEIKFVRMNKGQISGKIRPYTDPGCNCLVETEFTGAVTGNTMEGVFITHPQGSDQAQKGRWEAVRKAP